MSSALCCSISPLMKKASTKITASDIKIIFFFFIEHLITFLLLPDLFLKRGFIQKSIRFILQQTLTLRGGHPQRSGRRFQQLLANHVVLRAPAHNRHALHYRLKPLDQHGRLPARGVLEDDVGGLGVDFWFSTRFSVPLSVSLSRLTLLFCSVA